MVENVEEVGAELQLHLLGHSEVLCQREIPLEECRSAQVIAWNCILVCGEGATVSRRRLEGGWIKAGVRPARIRDRRRLPRNQVRTNRVAEESANQLDIRRKSRPSLPDAGRFPATEDAADEIVAILQRRQAVNHAGREVIANVDVSVRPI